MYFGARLFAATANRWAPSFGITDMTIVMILLEIVFRGAEACRNYIAPNGRPETLPRGCSKTGRYETTRKYSHPPGLCE